MYTTLRKVLCSDQNRSVDIATRCSNTNRAAKQCRVELLPKLPRRLYDKHGLACMQCCMLHTDEAYVGSPRLVGHHSGHQTYPNIGHVLKLQSLMGSQTKLDSPTRLTGVLKAVFFP